MGHNKKHLHKKSMHMTCKFFQSHFISKVPNSWSIKLGFKFKIVTASGFGLFKINACVCKPVVSFKITIFELDHNL